MKRSYTKEFIQNVVGIALSCGQPLENVASDFGVEIEALEKWIEAYKDPNTDGERRMTILQENEFLRKENVLLKEKIEMLERHITFIDFTLD